MWGKENYVDTNLRPKVENTFTKKIDPIHKTMNEAAGREVCMDISLLKYTKYTVLAYNKKVLKYERLNYCFFNLNQIK